jgi:hypothetical protein
MMKRGDGKEDEVITTAKPQLCVVVKRELKNFSFVLISIYSQS